LLFEPYGNGTTALTEQCDDGNATSGDGCSDQCRLELCPLAPAAGCAEPVRVGASKLRLENARKARLVWHWTGPGAPADFGDPVNTDAYLLCVYAPSLVATYAAPAGAGWQLIPDSRLDYRSRYGAPDG